MDTAGQELQPARCLGPAGQGGPDLHGRHGARTWDGHSPARGLAAWSSHGFTTRDFQVFQLRILPKGQRTSHPISTFNCALTCHPVLVPFSTSESPLRALQTHLPIALAYYNDGCLICVQTPISAAARYPSGATGSRRLDATDTPGDCAASELRFPNTPGRLRLHFPSLQKPISARLAQLHQLGEPPSPHHHPSKRSTMP